MVTFKNPMFVKFDANEKMPTGIQFSMDKEYPAYAVTENERFLVKDDSNKLCFVPIHRMRVIDDGFNQPKWYDESIKQLIDAVSTIQSAISDKSVADNSTDSGLLETTNETGTEEDRANTPASLRTNVPSKGKRNTEPVGNTVDTNKISSTVAGINL
jgi:hypothetical protein